MMSVSIVKRLHYLKNQRLYQMVKKYFRSLYYEQHQLRQKQLRKMGLSVKTNNRIFFALGVVFQVWFILMYALDYYYIFFVPGTATEETAYSFNSTQGFLMVFFLLLLFFLGFSLVNTYVSGSAYSSAMIGFLIIVFTLQYYFIIRSFWIGVGLGNDNYDYSLASGPYSFIRLQSNNWRLSSSYNTQVGMTGAIACALSILVAYMAVAGRITPFHAVVLAFFGVFFYGFNEICIWRHAIADNGYTLRLFLFGSSFGFTTGLVLKFKDKIVTTDSIGYFASRHTRAYGLLGASFVFLFLPILSCIDTIYDVLANNSQVTFLNPSILNLWFALSASCTVSYCISMLIGGKIHPHDIVYSSFAGGIAYGATSILNPDPFPAILCGLITGLIVTVLNSKAKKPLNNPAVYDTHGTLFTFFTAALIGGIYSAILSAVYPYPSDVPTSVNTWTPYDPDQWLPYGRSKIGQGALQIAATFWTIGIGMLSAIAPAIIFYLTTEMSPQQVFNDATFAQISDEGEEKIRPVVQMRA